MSSYAPAEDVVPSPTDTATATAYSVPRSNKKRRGPTSSSRGVANLTPSQLAKKRENDREAQRAIRERTKTQIEKLERTIRELTIQQPYQELQHAIQQKEAVEAENRDIKRRLFAILDLIQPLLHGQNPAESRSSPPSIAAIPSSIPSSVPNSIPSLVPSPRTGIALRSGSSAPNSKVHTPHSHPSASSILTIPSPTSWQAAIGPISSLGIPSTCVFLPGNPVERHKDISGHGPTQGTISERSGFGFFEKEGQELPNIGQTSGHRRQGPPLPADSHITLTMLNPQAPVQAHTMPILTDIPPVAKMVTVKFGPPTCTLEDIILKFLAERELQATEGVPLFELAGPADPDFSGILRPERIPCIHPVPRLFIDVLSKFPGFARLPERVAAVYLTHCVLRWQVAPTQENYDRLPEWMKPTPLQLSHRHPCWMTYVPWPAARDELVRNQHSYPFDDWFIPLSTNLSLNWPYHDNDTLSYKSGSDEMLINPLFEQHVRNLDNWSLGPAFAEAYPVVAECIKSKAKT